MNSNKNNKVVRFDWAMTRLLRNKAKFSVLEGLLTTLSGEKIVIQKLLESKSYQKTDFDKNNGVDMLAKNSKGELFLIEVQNNTEDTETDPNDKRRTGCLLPPLRQHRHSAQQHFHRT